MPPPRRGKGKGKFKGKDKKDRGQRALFRRRKFCRFTAEKMEWIDYKDVDLLKDFIGERQDHSGAHHRHEGRVPAPVGRGDQARALPRADSLHRRALKGPLRCKSYCSRRSPISGGSAKS